jgi:hypothetical protein
MKTLIQFNSSFKNLKILPDSFNFFPSWDCLETALKEYGINCKVFLPPDYPFFKQSDKIELLFINFTDYSDFKVKVKNTVAFNKITALK